MSNALSDTLSKYMGSQKFNDLCQAFVEQIAYGHQGVYPTATAAWNAQQDKAVKGIGGAQPGDLLYFHDPSQSAGHTGIYMGKDAKGNDQFTSATYGGVKTSNLNDWIGGTGQQLLGYVPQGHSAQSLGQSISQQSNNYLSDAQNTLDSMNTGKTPWDDNARAQANNILRAQNPQPAAPHDFGQSMANFSQVWNMTHGTPLSAYM